MSFKLFGRTFGKEGNAGVEKVPSDEEVARPKVSKPAKKVPISKKQKAAPKKAVALKPQKSKAAAKKTAHQLKTKRISKETDAKPSTITPIKAEIAAVGETRPKVAESEDLKDKDKELVVEKWEEDDDEDDLEKFADAPDEVEETDSFDDIV
jgi:hypothetical protein